MQCGQSTSPFSFVRSILKGNDDEPSYYNSNLKSTIEKIREVVANDPRWSNEGEILITKLQHEINTNNFYVKKRKTGEPGFSLISCVYAKDLIGLKYLLRVGENPNQISHGKAPIHVAAMYNLKNHIEVLKQHPDIKLSLQTSNGKLAKDLTSDDEIKILLAP